MIPLVYKDIILQKSSKMSLFILAGLCVAASVALTTNPTPSYFAIIMTAYMMMNYVHAYDFRYKTEALFRSLPVSRNLLAGSRYVSSFIFLATPLAVILILRLILCAAGMFSLTALVRAEFLIQITGIALLYFSIYLPFYFKFGYMKCRWVNFIGMAVSFGIPLSLVKISEELMEDGSLVRPDTWYETTRNSLALLTGTSIQLWNLVLLCTALAVLLVSFRLSLKIYRDKDCTF